ncbi:hypothetical protein O6H91_23G063400 [Diphasiastrum complanatum]|uniref:Uncharacterized protein n=1 Tax=Diphasiastrum complanatum TaxID=34168 RepID=A0ACC2ABF4_DIPCM|nr:hypothetical protein O6H91_23G063400 [Diphasiastrum complanatum]
MRKLSQAILNIIFVHLDRDVGTLQDGHGIVHKKHRRSWIDRSLSSRGRRTSVTSTEETLLPGISQSEASETSEVTLNSQDKDVPIDQKGSSKERCLKKSSILFSPNGQQRKRVGAPPDFIREQQALFAEVDAFQLQEETPSPVKHQSFILGAASHDVACKFYVHSSALEVVPEDYPEEVPQQTPGDAFSSSEDSLSAALRTPECVSTFQRYSQESNVSCIYLAPQLLKDSCSSSSDIHTQTDALHTLKVDSNCLVHTLDSLVEELDSLDIYDKGQRTDTNLDKCEVTIKKEPSDSSVSQYRTTSVTKCADLGEGSQNLAVLPVFDAFLRECGQTMVMTLGEAISHFCDINEIAKLGEGTYGEAFKGNGNVIKIVPMDGNFRVNGEIQKTSAEMYNEVLLTNALSKLRSTSADLSKSLNICDNFIEAKAARICQGKYDAQLVDAWEEWDAKHKSENEHPMVFPSKQMYVAFVLADGGTDLESFILSDFQEVKSLLLQVVLALAVAEEACGFEHRDLHWGNIVLARKKGSMMKYKLQGRNLEVNNYGVFVSLIDFTLSRIDTGKQVLFCNLSADPAIFEGPKGDLQADTYRRMLKVTGGRWEAGFPRTNCLWIHYLADTILTRKAFRCSPKEKQMMRTFRKRVLLYNSAKAASTDNFFEDMFIGQ